jgi:tetratricopeptide (TPR) repeat protein
MAADRSPRRESERSSLAIPPAPAVPRITPPPDPTPSYVPPETRRAAPKAKTEGERPRLSERVRDEIVADSRYSVQPGAEEVVWQPSSEAMATSPSSVPAPSTPAPEKPSSHPVGKIRSGRPPASNDSAPPTLFEVASLLDQGLFGQALEALGDDDSDQPPDHVLMRARALVGTGRRADALAAVDRLVARSGLDSDHRAASARLLVELGELEQALEQARLSSAEAPDSALTRLTHAWAAVRLARRTGRDELIAEAERMLAGLKSRGSPHPALLFALRACVHAQQGDPERAIGVAQRALALVPEFPDALAAIALGSARLGRTLDAQRASLRLVDVAHEEAAALTLLFERMGIRLGQEPAHASQEPPRVYWDALEVAWLDGRFEEVAVAFERTCRRRLSELAEGVEEPSFAVIGAAGATMLTTSPVWLNFAPYDFSFFSLERVAKTLDLLYENLSEPRPDADDFPVQVLLGAYLGETLRRMHAARWEGTVAGLDRVRIVARDAAWYPFVTLGSRLRGAGTLEFGGLDRSRLLHPGAESRAQGMALPVAPPCPWDPSAWPNPADIPALGNALMRSVISSYCARHAGGPLDGTISSLVPLESYLHLVAPGKARIEPPPPWAPRVATLCGAYLGEVLRRNLEGRWLVPHDGTLGPDSYRLRIGSIETAPVATVLAHLTGRSATPLHEHAARLIARGR